MLLSGDPFDLLSLSIAIQVFPYAPPSVIKQKAEILRGLIDLGAAYGSAVGPGFTVDHTTGEQTSHDVARDLPKSSTPEAPYNVSPQDGIKAKMSCHSQEVRNKLRLYGKPPSLPPLR